MLKASRLSIAVQKSCSGAGDHMVPKIHGIAAGVCASDHHKRQ